MQDANTVGSGSYEELAAHDSGASERPGPAPEQPAYDPDNPFEQSEGEAQPSEDPDREQPVDGDP